MLSVWNMCKVHIISIFTVHSLWLTQKHFLRAAVVLPCSHGFWRSARFFAPSESRPVRKGAWQFGLCFTTWSCKATISTIQPWNRPRLSRPKNFGSVNHNNLVELLHSNLILILKTGTNSINSTICTIV